MANITVEALGAGTKVLSHRMKKAVKEKGVGREGKGREHCDVAMDCYTRLCF
jgi:hypothetical protein